MEIISRNLVHEICLHSLAGVFFAFAPRAQPIFNLIGWCAYRTVNRKLKSPLNLERCAVEWNRMRVWFAFALRTLRSAQLEVARTPIVAVQFYRCKQILYICTCCVITSVQSHALWKILAGFQSTSQHSGVTKSTDHPRTPRFNLFP